MYRIEGFCNTSFASFGMKIFAVIILSFRLLLLLPKFYLNSPTNRLEVQISLLIAFFFGKGYLHYRLLGINLSNLSS